MLNYRIFERLRYRYFLGDLLACVFSVFFVATVKFNLDFSGLNLNAYIKILALIVIVYLGFLYFGGMYEAEVLLDLRISEYFRAILYSAITFFVLSFYIRDITYSRMFFSVIYPVNFIIAVAIRSLIIHYHSRILGESIKLPLIAFGFDMAPTDVISRLKNEMGLRVLSEVSGSSDIESPLESYAELAVANDGKSYENIGFLIYECEKIPFKQLVEYCEINYIPFYIVPSATGLLSVPLKVIDRKNLLLFGTRDILVDGAAKRLKRFSDVLIATIGLIFTSWLMLIIWMVIKITSPGPVIYVHERLGLNGKHTMIYKFRTMHADSEKRLKLILEDETMLRQYYNNFKIEHDPRITKVGKFLRKTSLDELPQLFNVLQGSISIVGPRPIIPEELSNYGTYARLILRVKPGLTGFWQVNGRSNVSYDERIRLDMYYIHHWSLALDVKIMLQTIPAVLKGEGAG